ncbi:MAG TPA: CocE/NonD family hydrolase, partial [Acidimicrobiia bacterium]|nr:CocE/NonD family hydrolase [Acidimicrobiia bacterium]
MGKRFVAVALAALLLGGACSGDDDDSASEAAGATREPAPAITGPAAFTTNGSINAAWVTDADPGTALMLVDGEGMKVAQQSADDAGSAIFYDVAPGDGYTVRETESDEVLGSDEFAVLEPGATPKATLYDQPLEPGLNYVKMRDGVELAMTLRLPTGKTMDDAPFATVIEYSGYQVAAPHDLLNDVASRLGDPDLPADPLVPSTSTAVGSLIAPAIGFATVSVQMRGTGCSGGAFDLFDYPTVYDGYDAVETVATQDWVKGGKVGMVGISFSGMTQLFTGGTQPPHLAAVAPLSVTDDLYRTVGSPGGIYNKGFAQSWLEERTEDAKPAPEGGQPWAKELVAQGDEHCIANQKLHSQARDVFEILSENPERVPELYDHRAPAKWGADIDVPIFMASAFQDEQIVGVGPRLVSGLEDNPNVYITLMNGTHVDPLGPGTITRWAEFLGLFVGDEAITIPDTVLTLGGALYQQIASAAAAPVEQSRFAGRTDVDAVKQEYRQDPRVRV